MVKETMIKSIIRCGFDITNVTDEFFELHKDKKVNDFIGFVASEHFNLADTQAEVEPKKNVPNPSGHKRQKGYTSSKCNAVKCCLTSANRELTHPLVDLYLSRHSSAFIIKDRTKMIKALQDDITKAQAILDNAYYELELGLINNCSETIEKTLQSAIDLAEKNKTDITLKVEEIKRASKVELDLEKKIMDNALSILSDTLYNSYCLGSASFDSALSVWFNDNGITSADKSLHAYIINGIGQKVATNKTVSDKGDLVENITKNNFNKLFLSLMGQLYKEKNVVNFIKFEEQLLADKEKAVIVSRQIIADNMQKRADALAEKKRLEQEEILKRKILKEEIDKSKVEVNQENIA